MQHKYGTQTYIAEDKVTAPKDIVMGGVYIQIYHDGDHADTLVRNIVKEYNPCIASEQVKAKQPVMYSLDTASNYPTQDISLHLVSKSFNSTGTEIQTKINE